MATGDDVTDRVTRDWLSQVFIDLNLSGRRRKERILEVMAGWGRNVPVYQNIFEHIELLDGSDGMADLMPDGVDVVPCKIQ